MTGGSNEDLRRRVQELELEVARIESRLEGLLRQRTSVGDSAPVERREGDHPVEGHLSPRDLLLRWVSSFQSHDDPGIELYRNEVAAVVTELVSPLVGHLRNPGSYRQLRLEIANMLGVNRLRGDVRAVKGLLAVIVEPATDLTRRAARSLAVVATGADRNLLANQLWSVSDAETRKALIEVILSVGGALQANQTLDWLLGQAPDEGWRLELLALVQLSEVEGALQVLRSASYLEQPVRLQAAGLATKLYGDPVVHLIEEWLSRETDRAVRRVLGEAAKAARDGRDWSEHQACGPPDAENPATDSRNAWAPLRQRSDEGEWLHLTYAHPMRVSEIRTYEVLEAGAIWKILLFDEQGREHSVWQGKERRAPGCFKVSFPTTSYRAQEVRLLLDTSVSASWNEIDAVELIGPEGSAWAQQASASSSYAYR